MNPIERFQKSQTIVTSKDTEAGGGLNLAVKRAKPNLAGPKSSIEENDTKKSEKNGKEKKNRNKLQQGTSQTATAVNPEQEQSTSRPEKVDTKNQSSSTPKPKQRSKLKCIDTHTPLEAKKILFGTQYRAKILSGGGPQRLWFGRTYNLKYKKKTGGDDARRK